MRLVKVNYLYLFILISFCLVYLHFLRFSSYQTQTILISDLLTNQYRLSKQDIENKLSNYPSLTVSLIPIQSLKARYYFNQGEMIKAHNSLDIGLKDNPYMVYSHYLKARIYLSENRILKSLEYLRKGFAISKNAPYLSSLYFALLSQLNLTNELVMIFPELQESEDSDIWKFYYLSLKNSVGVDVKFLKSVVNTASINLGISELEFIHNSEN